MYLPFLYKTIKQDQTIYKTISGNLMHSTEYSQSISPIHRHTQTHTDMQHYSPMCAHRPASHQRYRKARNETHTAEIPTGRPPTLITMLCPLCHAVAYLLYSTAAPIIHRMEKNNLVIVRGFKTIVDSCCVCTYIGSTCIHTHIQHPTTCLTLPPVLSRLSSTKHHS